MKIFIQLLILTVCISTTSFGQVSYRLNPERIDYGIVYIDTLKKRYTDKWSNTEMKNVWLINTGKDPIIISNGFWASEGCPMTFPKEPVLPGDSALITNYCVFYGRESAFNKNIILQTNSDAIKIPVTGEFKLITNRTRVIPQTFRFGFNQDNDLRAGEVATLFISVTNLTSKTTSLTGFKSTSSFLTIKYDKIELEPGKTVRLVAKLQTPSAVDIKDKYLIMYPELYFTASNGDIDELIRVNIEATVLK